MTFLPLFCPRFKHEKIVKFIAKIMLTCRKNAITLRPVEDRQFWWSSTGHPKFLGRGL